MGGAILLQNLRLQGYTLRYPGLLERRSFDSSCADGNTTLDMAIYY
jgi:hypothetical protein